MFQKEKEYLAQSNDNGKFYVGVFLGVLVGAGLYWLFKSETGKKVRRVLLESNEEWSKKAKELIGEADGEKFLTYEDEEEDVNPTPKRSFISTLPKRRFFRIKK